MNNYKKIDNIIDYLVIVLLIYQSGNIFFMSIYYKQTVVFNFLLILIIFIWRVISKRSHRNFMFDKKSLIKILFLIGSILATMLLNLDYDISPYLAIILQIVIAWLTVNIIKIDRFINIFINIMCFFSVISIICFIIQLIIPQILYKLPVTSGEKSVDYYNIGIHVFNRAKGYDFISFLPRNSSIFWEPGAFQAFLNIALFFIIRNNDKSYKKIVVLIIAIITTFSTTGFLVLCVNLICYLRINNVKNIIFKIIVGALILIVFAMVFEKEITNAIQDILIKYSSLRLIFERISFNQLEALTYGDKFNIFGIGFTKYKNEYAESFNSIIHTLGTLGIVFTGILFSMYYKFCKLNTKFYYTLFFIFIIIFSSESLMWRPVFLCFAFFRNKQLN